MFKLQFIFPTLVIWDMNIHNLLRELLSAYIFLSWRIMKEIKNKMLKSKRDKKRKIYVELQMDAFPKIERTSVIP